MDHLYWIKGLRKLVSILEEIDAFYKRIFSFQNMFYEFLQNGADRCHTGGRKDWSLSIKWCTRPHAFGETGRETQKWGENYGICEWLGYNKQKCHPQCGAYCNKTVSKRDGKLTAAGEVFWFLEIVVNRQIQVLGLRIRMTTYFVECGVL